MNPVDKILSKNQIEHESDKCLVRLIERAVTRPDLPNESILEGSGLSLKADLQLATAMIEVVKSASASVPSVAPKLSDGPEANPKKAGVTVVYVALFASLILLAGASGAYFTAASELKSRGAKVAELERALQTQQENSSRKLADLSEKASVAMNSTSASVSDFTEKTEAYLKKADSMAKEIAALKAQNEVLKATVTPAK